MSETRTVKCNIVIETTPELAFEAVTRASELREWFADQAWTQVRPGGRYEVRWESGYRAEGTFTALDAPRRAAVAWRGTAEPGETAVEVTLELVEGGVEVTVLHTGFGAGDEWNPALAQAEKGWQVGLENLKSTLETGVDLRTALRPFLGVYPEVLNTERAAKEGIAAEQGIYLHDTVEGGGARAAGLAKGDVIVAIAGRATPDYEQLHVALGGLRAGDVVDVELVRGRVRQTVQVTLALRPQPEVPRTAEALAQAVADLQRDTDAALRSAVEGVTEEESGHSPAEGEWSAKQVLAHLTTTERAVLNWMADVASAGWVEGDDGDPAVTASRLAAVLAVKPTLQELVDRLLVDEAETVAFMRALPQSVVAHRARFRRMGQTAVGLPDHTREHIEQIKATIAAIRAA